MFGRTAVEKALVDQWIRRVEFVAMMPVGNFWRHAHPRTAALLTQYKDFGESNRETFASAQRFFDRSLQGREFLALDTLTMADICLQTTVDFADWIGLPCDPELRALAAWRERLAARPSAEA
jgi:glutathione S-transferase